MKAPTGKLLAGAGGLLAAVSLLAAEMDDGWLGWARLQPHYETWTLDRQVLGRLRSAGLGDAVVLDVPAGGEVRRLAVRRIDLFARSAQTRLADGTRLPPDDRHFFLGRADAISIGFALDPPSGQLTGMVVNPTGSRELRSHGTDKRGAVRIEAVSAGPARDERIMACENDGGSTATAWIPGPVALPERLAKGDLAFEATVAIDTDNEFLADKFEDDTGAADRWISDLFVATNVFLSRDLDLTIKRGTTILRPSSETDPYAPNPVDFLGEFGGVWLATPALAAIDRQFAALLSGRRISANGFSGVAWVNAYCAASPNFQNFGSFSVNRIGSAPFISPAFVAGGFGHELGHNLGSRHTHCELLKNGGTAYVDQCFTAESGCYRGPTSCPADSDVEGNPPNTGTLMSYCNFSQQSGGPPPPCDSSDFVHPLIGSKLVGLLAANAPQCIRLVDGDRIFDDGFE